jgi:hypothetical protein
MPNVANVKVLILIVMAARSGSHRTFLTIEHASLLCKAYNMSVLHNFVLGPNTIKHFKAVIFSYLMTQASILVSLSQFNPSLMFVTYRIPLYLVSRLVTKQYLVPRILCILVSFFKCCTLESSIPPKPEFLLLVSLFSVTVTSTLVKYL